MNAGMTISVSGGNGGSGGDPGRPGEGGSGGPRGARSHNLCPKNLSAGDGTNGNAGPSGKRGPDGIRGNLLPDSIKASPITPSEFFIQAAKPAIVTPTNLAVFVGETVTVVGKRFAQGDVVLIRGYDKQLSVSCPTTLIPTSATDAVLTFVVPNIPGGIAQFQTRQTDGTLSASKGGLIVKPKIEAIYPQGRIRPGKDYFIRGTGLGFSGRIWINGEDIGPFSVVDNNTIKFKAKRPSGLAENPAGEKAKLKVVNAEGIGQGNPNHSAEVDIVFDTYRMLVFGDSVLWGGGLPEHQKFYSLAADYLSIKLGNAKVHRTIKAHHGAKIGRGDTTVKPEIPGELSTRWPTILQQVDTVSAIPDAAHVDLVIIGGGANDLPITDVMLVSSTFGLPGEIQKLRTRTKEYCYDDMVFMLQKVTNSFPNAKVIVTGYFHILSELSSLDWTEKIYLGYVEYKENLPLPISTASREKMIALSNVWVEESNKNLAAAVKFINDNGSGDPRTFFVNPDTIPANAAHAPNSFLWEPGLLGEPSDGMWKGGREAEREAHAARLKEEKGTLQSGHYISKRNSSYHPNPAGAQNYFQKMKPALDAEVKVRTIALRSSSGRYLSRTNAGAGTLVGSSVSIGALETFDLIDLGSNQVALRSNGFYVSAANGVVTANKLRIGAAETFTLENRPAQKAAFKTKDNTYLSVSGNATMTVTATAISQAGEFVVV
jgi:lysophospholipase L1-like esterase